MTDFFFEYVLPIFLTLLAVIIIVTMGAGMYPVFNNLSFCS